MNDREGFEILTEQAKRVLSFSQDEARFLQHNYIGTEHLLLGLVREDEGVAGKILKNHGVELMKLRKAVEFILGRGDRLVIGEISFTPRAKKVLELALDEAHRQNRYIGTEYLLLGLIREGDGIAAGILESLGVNLEEVYTETVQVLSLAQIPYECGSGPSLTPTLDQVSIDLTALARAATLDPVIGRQQEIGRAIQILSRRTKNNAVLVGEPGVGKTAIVEGLAQRLIEGTVPETIAGKRLLSLDIASLVAGTRYRGEFEERLKKVLDEIRSSRDCIVFVDEMHTIVGAGAAEGAIDASNILKPALARGEFQCIGATTLEDYRKYVERDPALQRRFQEVIVREPSREETLAILKGIRARYEAHHQLTITDDALQAAIELSGRYITDRFMPDKAIDLIDEAASALRTHASLPPNNIKEAAQEMVIVLREKEAAIQQQAFELAAELREREVKLRKQIDDSQANWQQERWNENLIVGVDDIARVVSQWTGIPVMRIAQEEAQRLLDMEGSLHKRIVGQYEAIEKVSRAVRRARAGLKDPKRPTGSFIFMGPTGVGKTELARALAEFMFGSDDALIKIDMSEFMERHAAARLVGAPPGYIGYEEGGQLTEAVRRKPYCVILLDEIEKAHSDVFNMLLQILEDGRLTDARGRMVDFRNTIIIMTSNVGASLLNRKASIGFTRYKDKASAFQSENESMKNKVLGELKNTFKPEFLNRIDDVIVFHSLRLEEMYSIIDLLLAGVRQQLSEHHIELNIPQASKDFLIEKGFDAQYGARPLRRTVQSMVVDVLAEGLLQGKFQSGDLVEGIVVENQLTFRVCSRSVQLLPPASSQVAA